MDPEAREFLRAQRLAQYIVKLSECGVRSMEDLRIFCSQKKVSFHLLIEDVQMTKIQARQLMDLLTNESNPKSPRGPKSPRKGSSKSSFFRDSPDVIKPEQSTLDLEEQKVKLADSAIAEAAAEQARIARNSRPDHEKLLQRLNSGAYARREQERKEQQEQRWQAILTQRMDRAGSADEIIAGDVFVRTGTRSGFALQQGSLQSGIWEPRLAVFDNITRRLDIYLEDATQLQMSCKVATAAPVRVVPLFGRKHQIEIVSAKIGEARPGAVLEGYDPSAEPLSQHEKEKLKELKQRKADGMAITRGDEQKMAELERRKKATDPKRARKAMEQAERDDHASFDDGKAALLPLSIHLVSTLTLIEMK